MSKSSHRKFRRLWFRALFLTYYWPLGPALNDRVCGRETGLDTIFCRRRRSVAGLASLSLFGILQHSTQRALSCCCCSSVFVDLFLWWSPKTLLACPLVFSSSSCYEIRASDRLEVLLFPFRPQSHHMITWINFPLVLSTTIKNDLSSFSHTILFLLMVSIPHCLRSSLYQFLSQVGFSFSCLLSNNGQIKPQIESLSFFFSQSRSLFLSRSIDREVSCYGQLDAIHKFGPFKCPAKVNRRLL